MIPNAPAPLSASDLAALFGFTLDELALNRAGRFSERQRQTLMFRSVGALVRGVALVTLAIVLAASLAPMARRAWEQALVAILVALIGVIVALVLRAAHAVARPTVETITGELCRAGDARHPCVRAGNRELRVSFRRWKRLALSYPGEFRFYFGPGPMLLSVEPASG